MEYNTEREHLLLREYGRNVQRMTQYLLTVEDKEKRSSYAKSLVELMKQLNPNVKGSPEYEQKVWDDLFIISNFELDVESPYPKPGSETLTKKPERVGYQNNNIRYRHFGKSIELLIEQAVELETDEEREGAVISIGRLMKSFYQTWNKDMIEDDQVIKMIDRMSEGKLNVNTDKIKELSLFDHTKNTHSGRNRGGRSFHKGKRNNNNNNNNRRRRNNN